MGSGKTALLVQRGRSTGWWGIHKGLQIFF